MVSDKNKQLFSTAKHEVNKILQEELAKQTPEQIQRDVQSHLNKYKRDTIWAMLGLEGDSFEGVRVRHHQPHLYNGDSELGYQIKEMVRQHVRHWILANLSEKPPELTQKELVQIKKFYRDELFSQTREQVREIAYDHARHLAEKFMKEATKDLDLPRTSEVEDGNGE